MICPLCQSVLNDKIEEKYFLCHNCKAIVLDRKYYLSFEEEKNRYLEHNNDVNDERYQKFTSPITNYILENYQKHHIGLDYGSGTAPVISKMLTDQQYSVYQYDPFFHPEKKVLNHEYNYIFSCEVFEHFHNPKTEIDFLHQKLKSKGELIFMTSLYNSTILFDTWRYRKDPTHVFIFQKETIEYIAKNWNLKIKKLEKQLICLQKM